MNKCLACQRPTANDLCSSCARERQWAPASTGVAIAASAPETLLRDMKAELVKTKKMLEVQQGLFEDAEKTEETLRESVIAAEQRAEEAEAGAAALREALEKARDCAQENVDDPDTVLIGILEAALATVERERDAETAAHKETIEGLRQAHAHVEILQQTITSWEVGVELTKEEHAAQVETLTKERDEALRAKHVRLTPQEEAGLRAELEQAKKRTWLLEQAIFHARDNESWKYVHTYFGHFREVKFTADDVELSRELRAFFASKPEDV